MCSGEQPLKAKTGDVKAVILAGGLGTRLRPYTLFMPKPMLPVGTKPILEHIIEWLGKNGVKRIVISTGYLGRMIEEYFEDGSKIGVGIEYCVSNRPMGIAGQLAAAKELLGDVFVCVYGDAILDFDLRKLISFHQKKNALATLALMRYETQLKYGVIKTSRSGMVAEWREKPIISGDINVGCYAMSKDFLRYIPEQKVYGMKEAFDEAIAKGERICALRMEGTFVDIGNRSSYREANERYLQKYGTVP